MNTRKHLLLALVLAAVGVLGTTATLRAEDPLADLAEARKTGEIHEAIRAKGIPLALVRCEGGKFELVFEETCSPAQQAEAEAIKSSILAGPAVKLVVDNVQDALVVIQFEPQNESAVNVLKKRYAELKAAAKGGK